MSILVQTKAVARYLRRALGVSPIQRVLRKLMGLGVDISELHALEVFGCNGDGHTKDYASKVAALEVWDISPSHEEALRKNLPMARVRICDSYDEIRAAQRKYDFLVIDNSPVYPPHVEHFDLFPQVLDIANVRAVLIVNIIPRINAALVRMYPKMIDSEVLERRKAFYDVAEPKRIPIERIIAKYLQLCELRGFAVEQCFTQRRNSMLYYLALRIAKVSS